MPLPNQPNTHQGLMVVLVRENLSARSPVKSGKSGFNPWMPNGLAPYYFPGYPHFPAQNQGPFGFNLLPNPPGQYLPPPAFAPPNYPPPGHNLPPVFPFQSPPVAAEFRRAALDNHPVKTETTIIAEMRTSRDHLELSALDWPTGSVRRQSVKSLGE
ncbi:hypothetical protein B0H10DRAFT_1971198, partial [Mycena sp. CBHHK59/15]